MSRPALRQDAGLTVSAAVMGREGGREGEKVRVFGPWVDPSVSWRKAMQMLAPNWW